MPKYPVFHIRFDDERVSHAVNVPTRGSANAIVRHFGLEVPRPVIFISGGADGMTEDEMEATEDVIECIAAFAEQHNLIVIDGGTESGVMKMIGDTRRTHDYTFPLIGVAPRLLVAYPDSDSDQSIAWLHDGHSHFVLVESDSWGKESRMIVELTRTIAGQHYPMLGILINGGKVAEQDIYLATTKGDHRIPILVLEGSGRKADEVSSAVKTGTTSSRIIRAIVAGGDISLVNVNAGQDAIRAKLEKHFGVVQK